MDVSETAKLERGAFSFDRFSSSVARPEIVQENDIEGTFADGAPVKIPMDLIEAIQRTSFDPEVEEVAIVSVEARVDSGKVTEENPTSRFRILDTAIKKPGICVLCRSAGGDGRQFVDFGQTVEFFGVVYFCTFCIGEVAKMLGFALESTWTLAEQNLQDEISRVDDLYVEAKVELDAARLLLRNNHCGSCNCSDSVSDSVPVDVEAVSVSDESSDDSDESGGVEESGDIPEPPVDDAAKSEPELEPEKPKRSRRGSSVTTE